MRRRVDPDSSPPLTAPLRFFANVPVFMLLAAGTLMYAGPRALLSRWSPFALAITHLLTLGVLSSAMIGALIQILPVVTGTRIAWERTSATAVHASLTAGALMLACAFMFPAAALYIPAALLLGVGFVWFIVACAVGFWNSHRVVLEGTKDVLVPVRFSLVALAATATLGIALACSTRWSVHFQIDVLTDLHVMWGLSGWVGLLTIGIAYQLIPMFQLTERYPKPITRYLALAVFSILSLTTLCYLLFNNESHAPKQWLAILLGGCYFIFAITTLGLLWKRRPPAADATTLFWRTAMVSLAYSAPLLIMQVNRDDPVLSVLLGAVLLMGVMWSAVNGMLYKIIPFLLWYHSQKLLEPSLRRAPKMRDFLPDEVARNQFRAHLVALVILLAACRWPVYLSRAAALSVGVSVTWLLINVMKAMRLYLHVKSHEASIKSGSP